MTVNYFLDTNVLVYAFDNRDRAKQAIAKQYLDNLFNTENYFLSLQVVNEFCNIAQKKLAPVMPEKELQTFIALIPENRILPLTRQITMEALRIQHAHQFSFWDSMIIAAALSRECESILTEDLSDSQKIGNVTIRNPFKTS